MALVQLIYTSAVCRPLGEEGLARLLEGARRHNATHGITGMLLYCEGTFFQVLEGEPDVIEALIGRIARDPRHANLTVIVRESIPRRNFGEWTMGLATATASELGQIEGLNDFFAGGSSLDQLDPGRAKKILVAFREGRWRTRLTGGAMTGEVSRPEPRGGADSMVGTNRPFSFAFQPIVEAGSGHVLAYEALIRGPHNEPASHVLAGLKGARLSRLDESARAVALELAARLGLDCGLSLNLLPESHARSATSVASTLEAAECCGIGASRIILEIVESQIIHNVRGFASTIDALRGSGVRIAFDDFGAGYAGLSLLAELQPEIIKLDMELVRGIDQRGPRQAIVRGILRTCLDLGIDVVAEGVETSAEYLWCREEGIELFQGHLIAEPGFQRLPAPRLPGPR